ncbi:MAG: response regulator, partial [Clostridia bacterium]|nr:response regulator [Clostridia bacterium]
MMKAVIVDDEEWCLVELAEMLNETGMVEITGSYTCAHKAMQAAIRDAPDIIFIDVQMPVMSGLELAAKIKELLNKTCIVLVSEKECFARNAFDIGVG